MFCRLFEFKEHTGIEVIPIESCTPKCEFYVAKNKCSVCSDKETNLYKNERFNWNISRTIDFSRNPLCEDEDTFVGAIKLIHPSYQSIWIVRWSSITDNKVTDTYSIFIKSEIQVGGIDEVNWYLKRNCNYKGRPLVTEDFLIQKQIVKENDNESDEENDI